MESFYSNPACFESRIEEEKSCPDFDKLIQSAENENAELVRFLEEETQKALALQKELDAQSKNREEHERSSNQLNEETKELQKRFLQNKDTNENLKKTSLLISQHEEELQIKYEMACSSLDQLRLQNFEVVERYQNIWKRYHVKYESSEMAGKLAGVKTVALEIQKEVNKTVERIKELKLQVTEAENEKKEMEDILHLGGTSTKKAIISLAEMYVEMSKKAKLAKENFLKQQQQQQQKQQKQQQQQQERQRHIEKENSSTRSSEEEQQNEQAMECETEHLEGLESHNQTEYVPATIAASESAAPESTESCQANNVVFPITDTSQANQILQMPSSVNTGTSSQLNRPAISTRPAINNGLTMPSSVNTGTSSQLNRPAISTRPAVNNGLTTINTRGLLGYPRLNATTPLSMPPSPLICSQAPTPQQHQLIDSIPVSCTSQRNFPSAFDNTSRGETVINSQDQVTPTNSSEQNIEPTTASQIQMTVEHTASSTTTKSPGPHSSYSSPNTPKTPTSVGQNNGIFNFGDYSETIQRMSKSPGEGFTYQSRPMFEAIQEEEASGDISTGDNQPSFFQPFFKPRQQEISHQFSATPTFFNMSPDKGQEEVDKQTNQFQPHSNTSSTSVCGSIFSMSTGLSKESQASTSEGFSLFGDPTQPGNHGNQLSTAKSPDFTFNFGTSPCITEERPTNQVGTFNLF